MRVHALILLFTAASIAAIDGRFVNFTNSSEADKEPSPLVAQPGIGQKLKVRSAKASYRSPTVVWNEDSGEVILSFETA